MKKFILKMVFWLLLLPTASTLYADNVVGTFQDGPYFMTRNGITQFNGGEKGQSMERCVYYGRKYEGLFGPYILSRELTIHVAVQWDGGDKNGYFGLVFDPSSMMDKLKDEKFADDDPDQLADLLFPADSAIANYEFVISPNGQYGLFETKDQKDIRLVDWKTSSFIKLGFNDLKVIVRQDSILCYINGNQVVNLPKAFESKNFLVGVMAVDGVKCSFKDFSFSENNIAFSPAPTPKTTPTPIPTPTPTPTPTVASTRLNLPNVDHFMTQNGITVFDGGKDGYFSWDRADWTIPDFTMRVSARWDGGLPQCYGLMFRQTDDRNFTIFEIAPNGYYRLVKVVQGQWQFPVDWQKTDLIKPGFNDLQVKCKGTVIICSLNGKQVINIQDVSSSASGKTGIGVGVFGGVKCSFKDLEVWAE